MKKWNWLRSLRCLAGVGVTLASSLAFAGDVTNIPDVANPDAVFQQVSNDVAQDLGACGCNPCECPSCECGGGSWLKCDGDPWKLVDGCDTGWNIGGWVSLGYGSRPDGIFISEAENGSLHANQTWLFAEKALKAEDGCLDWGGRVDLMYGTDAQNTQAFGNNPGRWDFQNGWDHGIYGWALPQAYLTLGSTDWDIKAGHFYTLHGIEVVQATGNFFYSHAYTFNFSEPFTHTGVMLHKQVNDKVHVHGGYVAGWDTGFDEYRGGAAFHGMMTVQATDKMSFSYVTCFGDLGWRGDGYNQSLVANVQITDKLKYMVVSDLVSTDGTYDNGGFIGPAGVFYPGIGDDQISIANYLIYQWTDCVGAGARLEWWKNDGASIYEMTYGVNIKPHANVTFRPEVRYDWNPGAGTLLNGRADDDQTSFNFDVIFTF